MQQLIDDLAEKIQTKERFTAVGMSVGHRDNPVKIAVSGVRQHKFSVPVQLTDKWHLGSITKSITATVIGKLVDDGVLKFDAILRGRETINYTFQSPLHPALLRCSSVE